MKVFLIMLIGLPLALATLRAKRAAYELPAGYKDVLTDELKTTFKCTEDGYYADVDNNCQIFHICHTVAKPGGRIQMLQWSFFCGNLTVFNQLTLTCTYPKDSVPCVSSTLYYGLNETSYFWRFGQNITNITAPPPAVDSISPKYPKIPKYAKLLTRSESPTDIKGNYVEDPPQKIPIHSPPSYTLNKVDKGSDSSKSTASQPPKAFLLARLADNIVQ